MKKLLMSFLIVVLVLSTFQLKEGSANTIQYYDDGNAQVVPVLMYHTFDENPKFPGINTKEANFKAHLRMLKTNGYTSISGEDLELYQKGLKKLPEKSVMITIDDGYKSVYDVAYPALKEFDMKATLFVITSHIESGERFELPMTSWKQLKEMSDSGYIEVENHTHDLHWRGNNNSVGFEGMITNTKKDGTPISNQQRKQIIIDDLNTAKQLIETNIGKESKSFSYPYGAYDSIAVSAVREVGYTNTHSVIVGGNYPNSGNTELIKRIGINSTNMTPIGLMNTFKSLNTPVKKQATGVLNVYSNNFIEGILWISGEQYSDSPTRMKEGRFELYSRNSNGQRTFIRQFGNYAVPTNGNNISVAKDYNNFAVGKYSLKMITTNKDSTRDVVWKDFEIK